MARPSTKATQGLKMRLSELYIGWLTSTDAQEAIHTLVNETLAAAQAPSPPTSTAKQAGGPSHSDPHVGYAYPSGVASDLPGSNSPSPPPSPPLGNKNRGPGAAGGKKGGEDRGGSPVHLSTRYLGVDEVDMANHRSNSPGGASPVSPNTALHKAGGGAHGAAVVDPHIPQAPPAQQLSFKDWQEDRERISPTSSHYHHAARDHQAPHPPSITPDGSFSFKASSNSPQNVLTQNVPVATLEDIPVFYVPGGVSSQFQESNDEELAALEAVFTNSTTKKLDTRKTMKRTQFTRVCTEVFKVPEWLRDALFRRIAASSGQGESGGLGYEQIKKFYGTYCANAAPNRRLFDLLRGDARRQYLTLDDFKAAAKQLVENHPGLTFLTQPEFQDFYCRTVAVRIMYALERQQNRKISWPDFDRSDLPETMRLLDSTGDINHVLQYFSYEHFYVLYCRFWEIDTDKDQLVGFADLQHYGQGALTTVVLERVVAGAGRKLSSHIKGKLDFEDFIYFCLSEEDKNSPAAIRYWFQVLDTDEDGVLSGHEINHFFGEQELRFREYSTEEIKVEDMLCQMLDMVGANKIKDHPQGLTLGDFLSCECPANFFNMVFNVAKFLAFEHRDPFGEHQMKQMPEKTDWDKFARAEYDRMASEASVN